MEEKKEKKSFFALEWAIFHPSMQIADFTVCSDGSNTILSNIDRTRTSFFEHRMNELERVHLLVIELEHPIFGFERSNIEL